MTTSDKRAPKGLDEAVRMFAGYVRGENGFDELDFKEWLIEWHNKQVEEVLDRLAFHSWSGAIEAERNRLKNT